ncbi:helix-turn-helix transcriptional regulator [Paenibacillus sacheonensis]|uniref:Helix-turn-helix domain-containing protein n=1 Tax=Paenibacillus sacheonensis TaxID=742054 RepID=A0A7X4YN90_9BACL|nr:helix-turn-helix transcriptional regulator [Paenibacillus sacheonensis]MBM7566012.1 AraC-like DNA-binding protein [Paenibacillus sacheonensis]NBC68676.1 helix-turn-helix domain-containing protein [Paenibacillus sacheonensis]
MEYPLHVGFYHYSVNKPRFVLPTGRDDDHWLLFALTHGHFRYRIAGIEGTAVPGDVIVCPPGIDVGREALAPLTLHYAGVRLTSEEAALLQPRMSGSGDPFRHAIRDTARHYANLRRIAAVSDKRDGRSALRLCHGLNELWLQLQEELEDRLQKAASPPDPAIQAIRRQIEAGAFEHARLQDLAAASNMNRTVMTKRFKAAYGITPQRHINMLRLNRAKQLLTHTNYTLEHIAGLCGYDSGSYLSRVFQEMEGARPSEYRRQHRL